MGWRRKEGRDRVEGGRREGRWADGGESGRLKEGKTLCLCPRALGDMSMCHLHGTIFLEIATGKLWI